MIMEIQRLMNRFTEIARVLAHFLWLILYGVSVFNLLTAVMSKAQKPNYVSSRIKKANEVDLKKALSEVKENNKEIRESFRMDKDTLAFRTSR
jgi:hypothetical protein